ncbi:peptide chain release factor 1-like, mitochondrial [Episyrphus balteatus]|uniref:peptide chain release factor 1-like, mitochondrial n=1 Tax=Episyrphus balteatus TaxID=286459 RepID=UPI00248621CB|nr:peptide chain release factor 1-like, mitochondrial [Episyrphus balteatus]
MFLRKIITNHCPFLLRSNFRLDKRSITVTHRKYSNSISFQDEKVKTFLENLRKEFYDLRVNNEDYQRINKLSEVVRSIEQRNVLLGNITSLDDMKNEKDEDMRQLIKEENQVYADLLSKTEDQLFQQMLTLADDESYSSLIFEVNAGAGGQEAMLFAGELFDTYWNFMQYKGWEVEPLDEDRTDIGGLRHANLIVHGEDAYDYLKYEAGVHRVQRIPATEKAGRVHTSTISIAVIPRPDDIDCTINEKDLKIETKRASGAGGQHVNTTDSAVRIVHLPTGIAVEAQSQRSQLKNREIAIARLQAKLLQKKLEESDANKSATRKSQVGSLNRNEKIRTYNFAQDRITDHRILGGTVHNLDEYFKGNQHLESLIERLARENRKIKLLEMISNVVAKDLLEEAENKKK